MINNHNNLTSQLKMAGIIARLPGDLPLKSITPVTDSLLASPIQAVEVVYRNPSTIEFISDLAQRSQGNLIIGVSEPDTAVSIQEITDAGAHYITTTQYDSELHTNCITHNIHYIPGIISVMAAQMIYQKGVTLMQLRTGGPAGPEFVTTIRKVLPDIDLLVDVNISEDGIGEYAKVGTAAIIASTTILENADQPMSDIITRARTLQKAWQNATSAL